MTPRWPRGLLALPVAALLGSACTAQEAQPAPEVAPDEQRDQADQSSDPEYRPAIAAVTVEGERPTITIDHAHANFHRIDARYAPFAQLARHGGYRVEASEAGFSAGSLAKTDILIIANAAEPPTPIEIEALLGWVAAGGSLLLIADHAPFGGPAKPIAERFGIAMGDGYVVAGRRDEASGIIDFRGPLLGEHPILPRDGGRGVSQVRSFLGQSLTVPQGASVLLQLPESVTELPDRAGIAAYRQGRARGRDAGGQAQALALEHGRGRVVVSGEAAMFTSQVARQGDTAFRLGVGQVDNEAYALNVLDWLARRDR